METQSCIHCGHRPIMVESSITRGLNPGPAEVRYQVRCRHCCAQGPELPSRQAALQAWQDQRLAMGRKIAQVPTSTSTALA